MKKTAVRLFALALCLVMALPAFSSCSGQKNKSDNTVIIYRCYDRIEWSPESKNIKPQQP